jgi:DNA-binding protein HU-beta
MNKADLIEVVQQRLGSECSRAHAERCVNSVLEAIGQGLGNDNTVQLVGFGTFQVRERKARVGLNPQTRQPMEIAASKTVGFRPGNKLKDAI